MTRLRPPDLRTTAAASSMQAACRKSSMAVTRSPVSRHASAARRRAVSAASWVTSAGLLLQDTDQDRRITERAGTAGDREDGERLEVGPGRRPTAAHVTHDRGTQLLGEHRQPAGHLEERARGRRQRIDQLLPDVLAGDAVEIRPGGGRCVTGRAVQIRKPQSGGPAQSRLLELGCIELPAVPRRGQDVDLGALEPQLGGGDLHQVTPQSGALEREPWFGSSTRARAEPRQEDARRAARERAVPFDRARDVRRRQRG